MLYEITIANDDSTYDPDGVNFTSTVIECDDHLTDEGTPPVAVRNHAVMLAEIFGIDTHVTISQYRPCKVSKGKLSEYAMSSEMLRLRIKRGALSRS